MAAININFEAPPTVHDFMTARDFMDLIVGPVGSGKSSGCCLKGGIVLATEMPADEHGVRRSRGCIVRNTYPQLRDTTIKTFFEWVPRDLGVWKESTHTFSIDFAPGDGTRVECEVLFRALDRPEHIQNLLSLELTWAYFNEWREIPKAITELMQTRVGRFPRKDAVPRYYTGVFGDSNAFDQEHYLYKIFFQPDPETGRMLDGHRVFVQPGGLEKNAENVEHLDRCFDPSEEDLAEAAVRVGATNVRAPEAKAEARRVQEEKLDRGEHESPCRCYYQRMMRGKRRDWVDCYVHNKFVYVVDGKPIYDNFNSRIHVVEFDEGRPDYYRNLKKIYVGNDYGLTPAAVFAHVMPDGQIRVSHEFVSQRMGAFNFGKEQAQLLRKEFPNAAVEGWGDPAGNAASPTDEEKTPISVVCGHGVPIVAAPTNEWTIRRDAFSLCLGTLTMTGEPELIVHPRCTWLVKALAGGYCLKRKAVSGEEYRDHPDKENPFSHVAEAGQYLVVGLGRDRRVLDGGQETSGGVGFKVRRSLGSTAEDGPRIGLTIRRSLRR